MRTLNLAYASETILSKITFNFVETTVMLINGVFVNYKDKGV